jgi:hypothetical protein
MLTPDSGLDFTPTHFDSFPEDTHTVVACHGLTGGSHESYVRNILAWVIKPKSEGGLGGRAVVVNVSEIHLYVEPQLTYDSSGDVSWSPTLAQLQVIK